MKGPGIVLVAALVVAGCSSHIPAATPDRRPPRAAQRRRRSPRRVARVRRLDRFPTLARLIGQKLVVRMDGLTPSADLLGRIRRGEVGGVILFGANITTPTRLIALTAKLRAAAAAGGQPPLLIAVDQEGGPIKRIPWAPPTISPPEMGRIGPRPSLGPGRDHRGRPPRPRDQRRLRAGRRRAGHDRVVHVPEGRTFSFDATTTAILADAFASGLESKGVVPTMKHFPGLGFATRNTDTSVVTIGASKTRARPGAPALSDGDRRTTSR